MRECSRTLAPQVFDLQCREYRHPNADIQSIIAPEDIYMPDAIRACETHPELVNFVHPLRYFREALTYRRKVRIVAIGSSSTAGVTPVLPYPPRLEFLLRHKFKFYGRMIDVLNRGISGQESPEELSRLETDVIDETPALVIWQVGTNAVYWNEKYNPDEVGAAIAVGLDWLAGLQMDVVLMDLQYTQAMVDRIDRSRSMVAQIKAAGEKAGVNVFSRFALMEQWVKDGVPISELDDGESTRLHTGEWATNCIAHALSDAIERAPEADLLRKTTGNAT
jgi:acyl-CoA thioesterase I